MKINGSDNYIKQMKLDKRIDKPGKYEEDNSYNSKQSVDSKNSENNSNSSADIISKKTRDKLLTKEIKRQAKEGISSVTTTPSPTQKTELKDRKYFNDLITIAECFNSPALPKEIHGREKEKERIAEYLSL